MANRKLVPARLTNACPPSPFEGRTPWQQLAAYKRIGQSLAKSAEVQEREAVSARLAFVKPNSLAFTDRSPHPSHGPDADVPRRDDGSLDHYYTMDKAELEEWGLDHLPPARRARADGWTPDVQAEFIRTLGDGGSVTRACQAVGRSRTSAYRLRRDPSARIFARAWDEAMASTATLLAETALDRAVNGQEEAVFYKGECVGRRIRYDNRLLLAMLRARDPLNYAPLDELERWEGRRPAGHDPEALADEVERSEAAWAHAPREELAAAGNLPLDTATAELERAGVAADRSHHEAAAAASDTDRVCRPNDEIAAESSTLST